MTSVPSAAELIQLGMDTSVNEIVVAVLRPGAAVRDLVRAGGDLLDDRKRMQQRLTAMPLRHGRVWRGGAKWSYAHRMWVDRQVFDEPRWPRPSRCTAVGWRREKRQVVPLPA